MNLWIICAGKQQAGPPRRCTAAEFEALDAREAEGPIEAEAVRPLQQAGRPIYLAPGSAASETAALYFGEAETALEPLLAPMPWRAFRAGAGALPLWLWRLMAWLCAALGLGRAKADKAEAVRRAEALLDRLEREGRDCVLICQRSFVRVLLDRARLRGYCQNRSGVLWLRPLERLLLTRRDEHCGGCAHNCLLSNPGCGVGRDKASRKSG